MQSEFKALAAEREARLRSRGMDPAAREVASEKVGVACPLVCSPVAYSAEHTCASLLPHSSPRVSGRGKSVGR